MTNAVTQVDLAGLPLAYRGKVRDIYELQGDLLVITTDRISAFDVVLSPGIPDKGPVLNCLSHFWFHKLAHLVPHHLVAVRLQDLEGLRPYRDLLRGRAVLVRKLRMLPIECVVRGYLFGSAWEAYQRDGTVSGIRLPRGLAKGQKLPQPIFTPSTKSQTGHDQAITHEQAAEMVGREVFDRVVDVCIRLFALASEYLSERGMTLCDTKFEFGIDAQGTLTIADEVLTPDSSRFWTGVGPEKGAAPTSLDKQIVRDYLLSLGWDQRPPAPRLPEHIVERVTATYRELFQRVVGQRIDEYIDAVYWPLPARSGDRDA